MKSSRKVCRLCKIVKPLTDFYAHKTAHDRHRSECKACNNAKKLRWETNNPERKRETARIADRRRRAADPERYRARGRIDDRRRADKKREYMKMRRRTDPNFNLAGRLRTALWLALKKPNHGKWAVKLLGCSLDSFKIYLESKFEPGMSWENHGTVWGLDHIMPLAIFDLTKPDHLLRACHVSNIQPMFIQENKIKSNKVPAL